MMNKGAILKSFSVFGIVFALIFIFYGTGSACRMYGAISDILPGAILQNHLVNLPNSIENLSPANPDGWSVGYYPDGDLYPTVNRGSLTATADPLFNGAVDEAAGAFSRVVISHVRNTSSGITPTSGNPHPFERLDVRGAADGNSWLMSHNGTIDKDVYGGHFRSP